MPTIVFHGDSDAMVHPRNGEAVVAAATSVDFGAAGASPAARPRVEQGRSAAGRQYTRTVHSDRSGSVAAEHWLVHGAGHAWSGGNAAGTYTDASGPDATREMLRFFFEHPRRAGH
jgi:poly(3-hydroxybutyrate) depolymerase